ncbi:MAG: hypothetical protein M3Y56_03215 [Armatimonadota bacterium]|nr:hypothetical protein [Armatimonadota bacterium]
MTKRAPAPKSYCGRICYNPPMKAHPLPILAAILATAASCQAQPSPTIESPNYTPTPANERLVGIAYALWHQNAH